MGKNEFLRRVYCKNQNRSLSSFSFQRGSCDCGQTSIINCLFYLFGEELDSQLIKAVEQNTLTTHGGILDQEIDGASEQLNQIFQERQIPIVTKRVTSIDLLRGETLCLAYRVDRHDQHFIASFSAMSLDKNYDNRNNQLSSNLMAPYYPFPYITHDPYPYRIGDKKANLSDELGQYLLFNIREV